MNLSTRFLLFSEKGFRSSADLLESEVSQQRLQTQRELLRVGSTAIATTGTERATEFYALVAVVDIDRILSTGAESGEILGRIARLLSASERPPIHLPRPWSEYHYKNKIAFFAVQQLSGNFRWACEVLPDLKLVHFFALTDGDGEGDLARMTVPALTSEINRAIEQARQFVPNKPSNKPKELVQRVDLSIVGSAAISQEKTYAEWYAALEPEQLAIVNAPVADSVRVVGPAGTGKTLALCMRAARIITDPDFISSGKRFLFVTHSWAMTERVDSLLQTLIGVINIPPSFSVMSLLWALEEHGNALGFRSGKILGDDTEQGRIRSIELIRELLSTSGVRDLTAGLSDFSPSIKAGVTAALGSTEYLEFILNVYEEIASVIAPQGIFPGDAEAIQRYYERERDETLPPFSTPTDRVLAIRIYERFLQRLVDEGVVTTDQYVLDAIRIFETFGWNARRVSEGYDYIFVDELQLFDQQERFALSLLARGRGGIVFCSAEDPNQGIYAPTIVADVRSSLAEKRFSLATLHRYKNRGIYDLIRFLYNRFPWNAPAIPVEPIDLVENMGIPKITRVSPSNASQICAETASSMLESMTGDERLAVILIGNVNDLVSDMLKEKRLHFVRLQSFDDIERLSYSKRSTVVAPWQFVGGTQFAKVLLIIGHRADHNLVFWKLRELTALYISASRAVKGLDIVCLGDVPPVLTDAINAGVLST